MEMLENYANTLTLNYIGKIESSAMRICNGREQVNMLQTKYNEYNVFLRDDGKYEGLIFDEYRRVRIKTFLHQTRSAAVKDCRKIIKNYRKGFTDPGGIWVDEGKSIREHEKEEWKEKKKNRT